MARWMHPDEAALKEFHAWVATKPKVIQDMAAKLDPWTLYRLKDTGHRCQLYAFSEDGTVQVSITGEYNLIEFGRRVFGIDPAELTECELPGPDELVGETMDDDQVLDLINRKRAENGVPPLTMEQLDAFKESDEPMCAIDTTPEVSSGSEEEGGEGQGQDQNKDQGKET
jgi:hypothetical protein